MDLSVCIPVYNEKDNLVPLLQALEPVLFSLKKEFEIVITDDGSKDGSAKLLEELATTRPFLKVIQFRRNAGQSAAFDAGFRTAQGKVIITMDADLQNDPKDIPLLLEELEKGFDFVTGWRKNRQDAFFRSFYSRLANRLIRWITRTRFRDLGCSLRAYRFDVVQDLRVYGEMHRFISVLVESSGVRVSEIPVSHNPRTRGTSKYGMDRVVKVLLDLCTVWFFRRYHTKPIYVFGLFGFGLLFTSIMLAAYTLYEKLALEVWVHKNPLFILSMIFGVLGVQFIGLGLLAEILVRTYFESQHKTAYTISKSINFQNS